MTKSQKAKWVKALRSGKYEQGREVLKTFDGKFCCLGVAREIGLCRKSNGEDLVSRKFLDGYNQTMLADMNDRQGKTFAEIADWIEKHL